MRAIFGITAFASVLLTLAACTASQPVVTDAIAPATPVPDEAKGPAAIEPGPGFAGLWYVSGVFPTAAKGASIADPHLGVALRIDAAEVSDINGQRCVTPAFQTDKTNAQAAGLPPGPAGEWDRLVVTCAGRAFATYILIPAQNQKRGAGSQGASMPAPANALLQQRPEALYLLEQAGQILHRQPSEAAEIASKTTSQHVAPALAAALPGPAKPAAKSAPETAPAPVPEGPVAVPSESPTAQAAGAGELPAPGTAIHLASYKGESAAKRGWKILLGDYDELDPLSPLYVPVDVPGKGPIIRLYATGVNRAELTKICASIKAKKVYCALNP